MDKIIETGVLSAIAGWALAQLFSGNKKQTEKNTDATQQNTLALLELKVEMKHLVEGVKDLKRLKEGQNILFTEVAFLKKALEGSAK